MSEVYREFGAKGMEIKVAVITAPINQLIAQKYTFTKINANF